MTKRPLTYSFIKPKLKPILSLFSLIWISLIGFISVVCLIVNFSIKILSYNLKEATNENQVSYDEYNRRIAIIKEHIKNLSEQQDEIESILATNQALKRSLQNIYDIVPDTVTLDFVKLDKNSLEIRGQTPSKEAFTLLMEAPLKSIFTKTKTTFYQLPNGWLNFSSISTSED
ncbi:MAG: hypothetical protein MR964_05380 [Campylobacter sp.]|uniref:hypothetical protein n=1 Tax=Campylobacter sp. TaxID=205 RepID=UPI002A53DAC7|nr:hypothetical protein [Campylobacter sp.]MDD7090944.1 hypothetical protein [Campylobacteraceae bacterium]MCI7023632.1 hypothetical protein [Campylobacter sp.]MCI7501254.1 hypothetical protein [Campylobacter sp.]MDY4829481.1 hypothetical protein [Campylobacter sp.]MDY5285455.1 hypothetical protein [Campylobacter sp.]